MESVLRKCNVDAHKKRDFAVADTPGTYLSTKIDNLAVMVLRGALVEILTLIDPYLYRKYLVIDSNGKPILYVKLQKMGTLGQHYYSTRSWPRTPRQWGLW